MSPDRKPWLYMKRLESWNPLAAVKPLLAPPPSDDLEHDSSVLPDSDIGKP